MELISIGKFAKLIGVTTTTLRRMHEIGELEPYHISKGGTRYYSAEQFKQFLLIDFMDKGRRKQRNLLMR